MTISISCPACGAPYNLNDQMRGKTVRCKSCQETFTVNGSSKPAPAGIKKGGAPAETRPAGRAMPPARGRRGDPDEAPVKKSGGKVGLIVGGVVGVIFLLCCGGVSIGVYELYYTGKNAADQFNKEYAEQVKKGQDPFNPKDVDAAMKQMEEEAKKAMAQQGVKPGDNPFGQPPGADSGTKPGGDSGKKPAGDSGKKPSGNPAVVIPDNPFAQPGDKVNSIDDALRDLAGAEANKRTAAAKWLEKAPLDKARQDEVAKALDSLVFEKNNPWPALNALQVWATKENVPTLVKFLDADTQGVPGDDKHKAMQILGKLQDERGAASVARFLPNVFAREATVSALRTMGPVAEKAVLKYFKHGDSGVHGAVENLLLGYGTTPNTIALQCIEDAKTATNQEDRHRVLDWLAKAKPEGEVQPAVTAGLVPLLQDRNPEVASRALRALGTWATKDNVPAIIAVLDDPSPTDAAINLRRQAMDTLVKLRDERAVAAIAKRLTVEQERGHAAKCLKELAAVMMPMVEAELKKYVESDNKAVRDEAANLLKQMGSKENVALAKAVKDLKSNDAGQRQGAAQVLLEMPKADEGKKDEVSKVLVEALDDPDEVTRHRSAKALGVWGTADSIMPLIQKVPDQSERMRHNVMEALGKLKAEQAVDAISLRLTIGSDRSAASKALQAIGGPKAEKVGQNCLRQADEELVLEGCRILQAVGTKASLQVLNETAIVANQKKKRTILEAAQTAMQAIRMRG